MERRIIVTRSRPEPTENIWQGGRTEPFLETGIVQPRLTVRSEGQIVHENMANTIESHEITVVEGRRSGAGLNLTRPRREIRSRLRLDRLRQTDQGWMESSKHPENR